MDLGVPRGDREIGDCSRKLTPKGKSSSYSEDEARAIMAARLEARRQEIEETILQRVISSLEDREANIPEYETGLRRAVPAGAAYGIAAIRLDDGEIPPTPVELLTQARTAAKHRVPVEAVLHRYIAAQAIFNRAVLDEARSDPDFVDCRALLASISLAFQALTVAAGREYALAARSKASIRSSARLARLQRLLNGEPARTDDLEYDFAVAHIGAVAEGPGVMDYLRRLADAADGRLLTVQAEAGTTWAWLGMRRPTPRGGFLEVATSLSSTKFVLGFGELGEGMTGWRRTHNQARAAFIYASQTPGPPTHYSDIAVVHSLLKDQLLGSSLYHLYLAPLEAERDQGAALRSTLAAYFAAGGNAVSAAAALGVTRHTVSKRLRLVESRIGQRIPDVMVELQLSLLLAGE
ncbi:MAG TPA: helix-turn-helix domain-containing protein [Solirubrobacterales bacterium]|nr:helix-turn-helix domain-containing protein [Solirubrobacterales bacterium]